MPTVLLEKIIEILSEFFIQFGAWSQGIGQSLIDIFERLGLIKEIGENIGDDVEDIKSSTSNIENDTSVIKTNSTNANSYLSSISTNTGSVVTPVTQIKGNTDVIVTKVSGIDNNTTVIANNMSTIATAASTAASFDEDIANNTLDIYNKIVTCVSDTTQMRSDLAIIIDLLQQIVNNM